LQPLVSWCGGGSVRDVEMVARHWI
jgi:hypothetical protein